ncbi:MAG: endopolygalacturonase, partial [Armatimonadota bacterium]
FRHAPLYQWAASGCVIRNGVFHESDGQWHSGWTNENLFENCVITSVRGHGGYGYGFWASPPEDAAHGPNGPRNVVWNCDVRSEKAGVWMGGMNEGWIFAYNRFVAATGPGVDAKDASFDYIIRGNVFVLRDGASPMVRLRTPDCIGVRVLDNALYGGNGEFVAGLGEPALVEGNTAYPLLEGDALPPRPTPPVPSIFEWQRENL